MTYDPRRVTTQRAHFAGRQSIQNTSSTPSAARLSMHVTCCGWSRFRETTTRTFSARACARCSHAHKYVCHWNQVCQRRARFIHISLSTRRASTRAHCAPSPAHHLPAANATTQRWWGIWVTRAHKSSVFNFISPLCAARSAVGGAYLAENTARIMTAHALESCVGHASVHACNVSRCAHENDEK